MNNIYFPKRRKVLQCPETTTESELQTTRSITSTHYEVPKIIIKTEESEEFRFQRNVFGDFLSEALLRREQTKIKDIQKPQSIELIYMKFHYKSTILSPSIRSNFTKYIMGEISAQEFVIRKNQSQKLNKLIPPAIKKSKRPKINVTYRRSAVTDEGNHDITFLQLLDEQNEEMLKNSKLWTDLK
ncbi:unnamed protein product [Paramecium octaurelia]|uniref:Uncharacterized protein n=1 Tax=Paramecium octaurelia TaxID=43137 RepID=A0A8S1S4T1_PAROT|nr:unnamed protein product [Paramecium octaurelia]